MPAASGGKMREDCSSVARTAQAYYNSGDADNFYFHVWGGEDIHVGIYNSEQDEYIARMIEGLGHWIEAGIKRHMAWGILHFHKLA